MEASPHPAWPVLKATAPTTSEGIERYLASGQMRGIGPAMAKRILHPSSEAELGRATFSHLKVHERLTTTRLW